MIIFLIEISLCEENNSREINTVVSYKGFSFLNYYFLAYIHDIMKKLLIKIHFILFYLKIGCVFISDQLLKETIYLSILIKN